MRSLLVLICIVLTALTATGWYLLGDEAHRPIILLLCLFGLAGSGALWWYAKRHFIEPDLAFRKWLQQVCDGELEARIDLPESHRHHRELHFHTRNLANALNSLSTDMEGLVESQTRRLKQQNKSLDLLYNLTADVSRETRLRTVLETTCRYVASWFGEADVRAWTVEENGPQQLARVNQLPGDHQEITLEPSICSELSIQPHPDDARLAVICVPYFNGRQVRGIVQLHTLASEAELDEPSRRVLNAVSEQLSLYSAKQAALDESRESQMMRDRAELAAEIHDSLAQTLAAMRYRVSVLRDAANRSRNDELIDGLAGIDAMVGEANQEVRGLISEYRKPLDAERSAESLRATVESFRSDSGLQIFFQTNNPQIRFTAREDTQLQRIVGEALNNAARYANASMIRVYLRQDNNGVRQIVIEDDGVGFDQHLLMLRNHQEQSVADGGNHIGLSIMRERAATIGAMLEIDSEPGEGTRISIDLPPNSKFDGAFAEAQ